MQTRRKPEEGKTTVSLSFVFFFFFFLMFIYYFPLSLNTSNWLLLLAFLSLSFETFLLFRFLCLYLLLLIVVPLLFALLLMFFRTLVLCFGFLCRTLRYRAVALAHSQAACAGQVLNEVVGRSAFLRSHRRDGERTQIGRRWPAPHRTVDRDGGQSRRRRKNEGTRRGQPGRGDGRARRSEGFGRLRLACRNSGKRCDWLRKNVARSDGGRRGG